MSFLHLALRLHMIADSVKRARSSNSCDNCARIQALKEFLSTRQIYNLKKDEFDGDAR